MGLVAASNFGSPKLESQIRLRPQFLLVPSSPCDAGVFVFKIASVIVKLIIKVLSSYPMSCLFLSGPLITSFCLTTSFCG